MTRHCYQMVIFGIRKGEDLDFLIEGFYNLDFQRIQEYEIEAFEKTHQIEIKLRNYIDNYEIYFSSETSKDIKEFYEILPRGTPPDVFYKYLDEWEGISGDLIRYIKEKEGKDLIYIHFIRDDE